MNQHDVTDSEGQIVGELRAHQHAAVADVKFARDNAGRQRTEVRFESWVHAADPWRGDLGLAVWRLRFEKHRADDVRSDAFDGWIHRDPSHHAAKVSHRRAVLSDPQMGVETEDFVP